MFGVSNDRLRCMGLDFNIRIVYRVVFSAVLMVVGF